MGMEWVGRTTEVTGRVTIMVTGTVTMTITTGAEGTIHITGVITGQELMIPMELHTVEGHQGMDTILRMNPPVLRVPETVGQS